MRGGFLALCIAVLVGCGHLDMYDQARYDPYDSNNGIFAIERGGDGAASRPIEEGTFARGQLLSTDPVKSGRDTAGNYIANPLSVSDGLIARGRDKYNVYCVPCHGQYGAGNGIAASYFKTAGHQPASFYDERLVNEADGYFFDVITNGRNADQGGMYSYASRVYPEDRWAIIAYIRSLQANPPEGAITPTPTAGANPNATAGAAPQATATGADTSATATGADTSATVVTSETVTGGPTPATSATATP